MISAQKSGPRVVVVGTGSLFFGRQAIWQMVHSPHLQRGTLVLVDTDEERLSKLVRLAEMVRDTNAVPLGVEGHTDWVSALPEANFLVLSFANRTVKYRGIDLMRYTPGIKSFALCDSLHMPHIKVRLAGMAGIEAAAGAN